MAFRGFLNDSAHRTDSNPQLLRNLLPAKPRVTQISNPCGVSDYFRAVQPLPLRACVSQPGFYPLHHETAFQFSHGAQDREDHFPGRRGSVYAFGEAHELDAQRLEVLERAQQVRDRPSEAVELPDHDHVELAAMGIGYQAIELGAPIFGSRDPHIDVFPGDRPAAALGIIGELAKLHSRVLAVIGG
jgi:hypothetical protein